MDVLGRYRNLVVLVGVLFAQVLGLAVQVRRTTDDEPTRLIRIWTVGAVSPVERTLVWAKTSSDNLWKNYLYLRGVRAENRALKEQIEHLTLEQVRLSQDADQAHRLQTLLEFKEQFISQTTAAQVIGGSGSEQSRLIYIDKGYGDGIRPDMAVITAAGVVGKVLRTDRPHVAQVLLIDDQSSGVGAILETTRLQGILRGTPSGDVVLEKVMSDETVTVGEQVLTSGGDGIFPKGLVVGRVTKVKPGSDLFLDIRVRPGANLSRLEEVLVVTKIDERQAQPDQTGTARAVDILAERLPGVPAKTDAGDQSAVPGANAAAAAGTVSVAAKPAGSTTAATGPAATATVLTPTNAPTAVKSAASGVDGKKPVGPPQASVSAGAPAAKTASVHPSAIGAATGSVGPAKTGTSLAPNSASSSSATGNKGVASDAIKVAPKPVKVQAPPKPLPPVEDHPN
ncbi:MAG: rod shape-determining protein MreC [Terriglobales bacterium]